MSKNIYYSLITEPNIYGVLLTFIAFLFLTFNSTLATIYAIMVTADGFIYLTRKNLKYNFDSVSGNTITAIAIAIGAFAAFSGLTMLLIAVLQSLFPGATSTFFTVLSNNMVSSALPLANNTFLAIIVWGLLIPLVETRLVARLMELSADVFNLNLSFKDIKTYILFLVLSGGATWFHLTAKGTKEVALLVTFVFFFVTCILIVYTKESESAVYLHQINNTAAVLRLFNIIKG